MGLNSNKKLRLLSCMQILKKALLIFLQDCFILMYLIRNHPAKRDKSITCHAVAWSNNPITHSFNMEF